MSYTKLFSPMKIGNVEIKNRVVMTAMGVSLANLDGTPSQDIIEYYVARAKGGTGLIINEVTRVCDVTGVTEVRQLCMTKDEKIPAFKKMTDAVHEAGAKMFCQLHHPGRQTYTAFTGISHVLSSSDQPCGLCQQPTRAMTLDEIRNMVEKFVSGAVRAQKSGYDGVEIHAAHGYLLNQFLSSYVNHREDEYGGTLENRLRIVMEIIDGIHERCGKDYPISVRLDASECLKEVGISDAGIEIGECIEMCKLLEAKGVDVLNISTGIYETANFIVEPHSYKEGWRSDLVKAVKESVSIPVMGNAVIRHPAFADKLLEDGYQDFISMGRTLLADPEWANKAREGKDCEIKKCISCLYCFETVLGALATGDPVKCAVNPLTGHETKYPALKKDGEGKTVAVVGGGIAGMQAAVVLAKRGFKTVLFEQSDVLGGQLNIADKPPMKTMITELITAFKCECENQHVEIRLNTRAEKEDILAMNPYGVVIATGGEPLVLQTIKGIEKAIVNDQVLSEKVEIKDEKVIVVGGSFNGLETAEFLAEKGNQVTVVEMMPQIGKDIYFQNLIDMMARIQALEIELKSGSQLVEVADDGIVIKDVETGATEELKADKVVLSMGTRSVNTLEGELADKTKVIVIGDAKKIGRIGDATRSGYEAGLKL